MYKNGNGEYEVVDGQQRILSFLLLNLYLRPSFVCALSEVKYSNKITQKNIHANYKTISEWFSSVDDDGKKLFMKALNNILEMVVITVNKISEAFQLFDSQNTRGRALYPHDLLKAYHLREIYDKYEMQHAVTKWESKDPQTIRELFDHYLFPLWNWAKCRKCGTFTIALLCYYDRFHNFDVMAVTKLFTWAMMIRVDMNHLGFDTINRYTIGRNDFDKYSNAKPIIAMIAYARRHTEIAGMRLTLSMDDRANDEWKELYSNLCILNGHNI